MGLEGQPDHKPIAGFKQWLRPTYAEPPASKNWNQEAVYLATLPKPCAHPTLLFYIFGDQGSLVANKWNDLRSQEERTAWLAEYFKPYLEKLPYYNTKSIDCIPSYCLATSWITDDLAGNGSYSNFPVGLKQGDRDIETMREGVPKRNLWFAGEHTASFLTSGTVTGAYLSGQCVARRIAEKYGIGEWAVLNGSRKEGNNTRHSAMKAINVRGFADDGLKRGG